VVFLKSSKTPKQKKMTNNENSVPSTAGELLALNELRKIKEEEQKEGLGDDPKALAYAITELQEDFNSSAVQDLMAAIMLVEKVKYFHHDMIENAEELELNSYQKTLWKEDYKALKVALKALRSIEI
jgi:hypothetical protein